MQIFRLIPHRPGAHWALARNHGEIVVRAQTSGEARTVAAQSEAEAARARGEMRAETAASAFRNPHLYSVRRDTSGRFPAEGAPRVLAGSFGRERAHDLALAR